MTLDIESSLMLKSINMNQPSPKMFFSAYIFGIYILLCATFLFSLLVSRLNINTGKEPVVQNIPARYTIEVDGVELFVKAGNITEKENGELSFEHLKVFYPKDWSIASALLRSTSDTGRGLESSVYTVTIKTGTRYETYNLDTEDYVLQKVILKEHGGTSIRNERSPNLLWIPTERAKLENASLAQTTKK